MGVMYLLYESASGYALFERVKSDEVSVQNEDVNDLKRFSNLVKFKAFVPFDSAESALENINAVSEGEATKTLTDFLEANVPKDSKITIGVLEPKIGNVLSEVCGYKVKCNDMTLELIRGIRLHFTRFIKAMKDGDLQQAMLGLGHSYSRSKVKFNVHRVDNMIIQSSALLEGLDKDLNTFSMRVREWYSWHFPELVKIVNDNYLFSKLAVLIGDKSTLSEDKLPAIEAVLEDPDKAKQILDASRMSMGTDISPIDLLNIHNFAQRVVSLTEYRKNLHQYLSSKMNLVAPNLSALIGEQLGARLISHAGSLTSLAKYPASTVQILGAEKALFRALKTKGNTPKYGLIFHSSAIGRAGAKHKGRISRYLANKCSMASRIDSFTDPAAPGAGSNIYGTKLKQQVEERLEFYKTGAAPRKNIDVMQEAAKEEAALDDAAPPAEDEKKKKSKKDKKRKAEEEPVVEEEAPVEAKKAKKEKKEKKEKKDKKKDKKEESD